MKHFTNINVAQGMSCDDSVDSSSAMNRSHVQLISNVALNPHTCKIMTVPSANVGRLTS